jgi:hypothetical protein
MTIEVFAEWLRRQGHKVIRTASSYWFNQGPQVFQAMPYHWRVCPSESELRDLLVDHKAIGLRYSTSLSSQHGSISYHAVCEDRSYDLDKLGKWARKNVRRGLKNCFVGNISFDRLADEGWWLQLDTLDRQGRRLKIAHDRWQLRCKSASDLPGFEAWGAVAEQRLAASVITFIMGDCCYMLYQQCHRDFLPGHVNNALAYTVTKIMMNRPQVKWILYGLHSLDAPQSVDEFKFRMGYAARPVLQRVAFHPALEPFFNKVTHSTLKSVVNKYPGNPSLAKAEGLLRFYLQGRQKLHQQPWPECLADRKEEIMRMASVTN